MLYFLLFVKQKLKYRAIINLQSTNLLLTQFNKLIKQINYEGHSISVTNYSQDCTKQVFFFFEKQVKNERNKTGSKIN